MKLDDIPGTELPDRNWFQKVLDLTRNKISFFDNLDGVFVETYLETTETKVRHSLGRVPRYVFEVASYPNGTAGISFTQAATNSELFLKRSTAGSCTLFII